MDIWIVFRMPYGGHLVEVIYDDEDLAKAWVESMKDDGNEYFIESFYVNLKKDRK